MGLHDFSIILNHPDSKYRPGQNVRGKIHFKLDSPKKTRGVYVKLKGIAKVSWTERSKHTINNDNSHRTTRYHGEYEYFNERIYFLGKKDGDTFELAPNEYDYEFQYNLPDRLPSSYEGYYGSIEYIVKAVLDIPLGFDDEEEIKLHISPPVNLNSTPYLNKPEHRTAEKHLWCCCCKSGPLRMEINMPKTGYGVGEHVPINVDVENPTSTKVKFLNCVFKQRVTLHSEYPSHHIKDEYKVLCSKDFQGVAARSTAAYNEILTLPADCEVLNFDNCRLLEVSHEVEVTCDIAGCHTNLTATIPVTLGSTPLTKQSMVPPTFSMAGLGTPYPYEAGQGDSNGSCTKKQMDDKV